MSGLTELDSADAYCRRLTRRQYENFAVVSIFLPRSLRTHLERIYAFCRTTDDFGDESNGNGLDRLESWRLQVEDLFTVDPAPVHPVLISLAVTVRELAFGPQPFFDLIRANVQDQTVNAYEGWEDLLGYCMLSAAPVGRMVLRVFGIGDDRATRLSDDVCVGLQLANHAQDVRRDSERGRNYLLQSVLGASGLPAAVRDLTDRAEHLLCSGRDLEKMAPLQLRAHLALYRLGGMEVVRAIRSLDYRTELVRPTVSAGRKAALVARALAQSVSLMDYAAARRAA